jgi:hypothetical protein
MTQFDPLRRELDRWGETGRVATWWWRDDDAARPSDELIRIVGLAQGQGLPLALAVVPAQTDETLVAAIEGMTQVCVLQHGYAHRNEARPAEKKIELGPHRPAQIVIGELATGKLRLESLFGPRALPVLVPPWNRIAAPLVPVLPELGYRGLSQFAPRLRRVPVKGLIQANCHVDLMDWHTRRFAGPAAVISALAKHLALRYAQAATQPDLAGEPTGLMSHHAVHDQDAWGFLEQLVEVLKTHPATRALPAHGVFEL